MIDLRGIIAISGQSGLFKVISKTKFGLIVESIADGKRLPAYSSQRISALEDIKVFTTSEDISLSEVFQKIADKEKNGAVILDTKANNDDLRKKLEEYLPEYDKERVYASDIKKLFSWYNLLQSKDLLKQLKEETTETNTADKEKTTKNEENPKADTVIKEKSSKSNTEEKEEKPKTKKTAKAKEANEEDKTTLAKAEKKKTPTKKTTNKAAKKEGEEKPDTKTKKTSSKKADK